MNDNKTYISSLIDSVHELAGLLQLSLSEGEIPAALPELIRQKADDVASRCAGAADMIAASNPVPAPVQSEGDSYFLNDEEIVEATEIDCDADTRPAASEKTAQPVQSAQLAKPENTSRKKPAGVFTLNDRFLFTRELFGGRRELFDRAMVDLAGMDSYEEAEDFFLYQHGMNPDDPNVGRFLNTVARLF